MLVKLQSGNYYHRYQQENRFMRKRFIPFEDRVITGHWGKEPIWRERTPEEKLIVHRMKPEPCMIFVRRQENKTDQH